MISMKNNVLLDFLCVFIHLLRFLLVNMVVQYITSFCKCWDAILLSGEACHRLDLGLKRSKKRMLLFHYVIYSISIHFP